MKKEGWCQWARAQPHHCEVGDDKSGGEGKGHVVIVVRNIVKSVQKCTEGVECKLEYQSVQKSIVSAG
jgi:hypothetical protein